MAQRSYPRFTEASKHQVLILTIKLCLLIGFLDLLPFVSHTVSLATYTHMHFHGFAWVVSFLPQRKTPHDKSNCLTLTNPLLVSTHAN